MLQLTNNATLKSVYAQNGRYVRKQTTLSLKRRFLHGENLYMFFTMYFKSLNVL